MLPEFCSLVSVPCSRDTFSPIETLHSFGWYCNPEGCVLFETFALFVTVFSQLPLTFASSSAPGRLINSSETSKTTNSAKKSYTRSKLDKRYCTAPQMIPRPEMIPKLNRKWSRTANDPRCGLQMIPSENEEWHGICSSGRSFDFQHTEANHNLPYSASIDMPNSQ